MLWSHNKLVIARVKAMGPRKVYSGLLWLQRENGYKRGWVFYKFIEIYDKKPAPQSTVEPEQPGNELLEVIGIMQNRRKAKRKREELKAARLASDASQYRDEAQIDNGTHPLI